MQEGLSNRNRVITKAYLNVLSILCGTFPLLPNKIKPIIVLFLLLSLIVYKTKSYSNIIYKGFPLIIIFIIYFVLFLTYSNRDLSTDYIVRVIPFLLIPFGLYNIIVHDGVYFLNRLKIFFLLFTAIYAIMIICYLYYLGCFSLDMSFSTAYSYITNDFLIFRDHPIYISSYFSIAILTIVIFPFKSNWKNIILLIILSAGLLILSRKGSILPLIACCLLYLIKIKKVLRTIFIALILLFSLMFFIPVKQRLFEGLKKENIFKNSESSSGIRLIIWQIVTQMVVEKDNYFGYRVGEVQNKLNETYIKKGYPRFADQNLNAHNQYLQFGLNTGFIGLTIFLIVIIFIVIKSLKNNFNYLFFVLFFLLLFLTESYLGRQNGILFFTTIVSVLLLNKNEDNINRTISSPNYRSKFSQRSFV